MKRNCEKSVSVLQFLNPGLMRPSEITWPPTVCVQESSIKGNEPEEKENPKTQNYLLRQIRSRKGNIWLARRRMVGGVGAVHG